MAPAHESETIVFNFRKLLSTLPNYAELEQILLFSVNWGKQVCNYTVKMEEYKVQHEMFHYSDCYIMLYHVISCYIVQTLEMISALNLVNLVCFKMKPQLVKDMPS